MLLKGDCKMGVRCAVYKHFKGNEYSVYSRAITVENEQFVLYRQNYGDNNFWIRPVEMFYDEVSYNGKDNIPRFKYLSKLNAKEQMRELVGILKENNIAITHSETNKKYFISSINDETSEVVVAPLGIYSSYLTDAQLSYRMGYDLYKVNDKITTRKTCFPLCERQKLQIILPDEENIDYQNEKVIINQMNPCSIDLHISGKFYKPCFKKIDMSSTFHHSVASSKLWKKVELKTIKGEKGLVLWPHQTIVTYTREKIALPLDCAGKIEIKSTYARLGLSVTASDFCNPGWKGHFPLTIRNNGNHKIVLHPKEKMLQLSLIPTNAPIINDYSKKGVFMDDDGTPFRFWRSQTVKKLGSDKTQEKILQLYQSTLLTIEKTAVNVEGEKDRFTKTFLDFCEKNFLKKKYRNENDTKNKLKLLWKAYKKREQTLSFFFSKPAKISAVFIALIPGILAAIVELYANNKLSSNIIIWGAVSAFLLIAIIIVMFVKAPGCYCTFEKLDFDKVYVE